MLPSVPPQMSVRCSSTCPSQDLVISIDFGINPRLPLFVPRRRGTVAGFVRPVSVGTIHNRLQSAADKAAAINLTNLSAIRVGLQEKYSGKSTSVGGVDAKSTYCYLAAAEHRDEDTWECIYWMLASKVYP